MAYAHLLTRIAPWLALLIPVATAHALEVSPLRITLPPQQRDGELWLYNDTAAPWSGQARLYRWEQRLDAEVLEPAEDLALSPSQLRIAGHARQRLRIVRLGQPPHREQGYRLVIRPGPDTPAVQVSLPVFLAPTGAAAAPALTVALREVAGTPVLELYNAGHSHARLSELVFTDSSGRSQLLLPDLAGYVLAQRTRQWPLPGNVSAYAGGRFSARVGDDAPAALPPASPPIAPPAAGGL